MLHDFKIFTFTSILQAKPYFTASFPLTNYFRSPIERTKAKEVKYETLNSTFYEKCENNNYTHVNLTKKNWNQTKTLGINTHQTTTWLQFLHS